MKTLYTTPAIKVKHLMASTILNGSEQGSIETGGLGKEGDEADVKSNIDTFFGFNAAE